MSNNYDNIRMVKGDYDLTLFTNDVTEGGENQLTIIPIPATKKDQPTGEKDTKIVDLLRITNTFHIICYIVARGGKTGVEIKKDLKKLFKGAGIAGGAIQLTYDTETFDVFAQKWVINKLHAPKSITTNSGITDVALYMCTLDLVEGSSQ